jgi:hypothetical protein
MFGPLPQVYEQPMCGLLPGTVPWSAAVWSEPSSSLTAFFW